MRLKPTRPAPPRPKVPPPSAPTQVPQGSPSKAASPTRPTAPPSPKKSPPRPQLPPGTQKPVDEVPKSSPASVETYEIHHRRAVIPHDKSALQSGLEPHPTNRPDNRANDWEKANSSNTGQQSSLLINNQQPSAHRYNRGDTDPGHNSYITGTSGQYPTTKGLGNEAAYRGEIGKPGSVLVPHTNAQYDNKTLDRYKDTSRVVRATATSTALSSSNSR